LGGGVFDILGKMFRQERLRDLLIEAIRYGDRPDVRSRLEQKVDNITDRDTCRQLLEERALARDAMDASEVQRIREEMERAEAVRLQPHFIQAYFLEAFWRLGVPFTNGNLPASRSITRHTHSPTRSPDWNRCSRRESLRTHHLRKNSPESAGQAAGHLRVSGSPAARLHNGLNS